MSTHGFGPLRVDDVVGKHSLAKPDSGISSATTGLSR
jgi:hypothetical protein